MLAVLSGIGVALVAALLTWLTRVYALRRGLMDAPGERRSHAIPTPRGGGIAIVLVVLAACGWLMWGAGSHEAGPLSIGLFASGLLLVAGIGWIDDHRPLSAAARFAVHLVAAGLLAVALRLEGYAYWLVAAGFLLAVSLINIWNFMDGINGLAASQAAIAAAGFALITSPSWSIIGWALCAGCLGFLPFNFPKARIFLGDVGSGALGYVLATLAVVSASSLRSPTLALLPLTVFCIDAGFTLARRVLRGDSWWQPHTTHAYQCAARRLGHTLVTLTCAGFTLTATIVMTRTLHLGIMWGCFVLMCCLALASFGWLAVQTRGTPQG